MDKVYVVQDNDCHWYVIPYDLKDEFFSELEKGEADEYESFCEKFDQYMTGGDINNVQLYAEL